VIYDVRHKTVISYQQAVSEAHHVVHLMPRDFERQQRIAFVLHVEPVPSQQSASRDYFGNGIHHLTFHTPHNELIVESRLADVVKGDGRLLLKLKSGAEAPVSRTYAKAVKDAGWT
jgi:transglutaminase-like putative cysteine protease